MEYSHIWEKVLASDEKVDYEFSISNLYLTFNFFVRIIITLIILPFIYVFSAKFAILLFFLVFLCLLFFYFFYLKEANAYAFTNKRLIIHRGWLSTEAITIDYPKITDLTVIEPFFECLLMGSGDLHVDTAGTPNHEVVLRHIARPYEARKRLEEIRAKNEKLVTVAINNPQIND